MGQVTFWQPEHSQLLGEMVARGTSYSIIAEAINAKFGTSFTRNATIGRAARMGLVDRDRKRKPTQTKDKPPRIHAPRVRIIAANGNSNAMRVVQVSETAQYKLRCVEIEPRNLSLIELERGDCRYPYGPFGDEQVTFCGHPIMAGSSYCTPHHHLCWVKPQPSKAKGRVYTGTDFARSA